MRDLSIIIVNWNSLQFTEACLDSITRTVLGLSYEVIVVDNASADAPCHCLAARFPDMKLLLNSENIGFGRANNLGAEQANGEILLFLNPDTIVEGSAIIDMFFELTTRPFAGVVGCRMLNGDRTLQLSSVQSFPTIVNQVLSLHSFQRLWPRSPLWGKKALYMSEAEDVHRVDVVSGAALMIKHSVFAVIGGFNPLYFMYAEEVDLCAAVHKLGLEILHCSKAQIVHFGGESSKQCKEGFADIAMRESVYNFFGSTRGHGYALLFRGCLLLSAICRLVVMIPLGLYNVIVTNAALKWDVRTKWRKWFRIGLWTVFLLNAAGWENKIEPEQNLR